MRWLVIVLLLLNLAYFTWKFNQRIYQNPPSAAQSLPPDTAPLKLLQDLEELPAERIAPHTPPSAAATLSDDAQDDVAPAFDESYALETGTVFSGDEDAEAIAQASLCLEFGPVAEREQVRELQRWLAERALWTRQRVADGERRRYFWVYLEPLASDGDAQSRLTDLAKKGVHDFMLIKKGGLKNAISLGVFSSQDSVNRRLAELTDQGYRPLVVPRFEIEKKVWISAGLSDNFDINALLVEIPVPVNGRQRDCSQIALAPGED